MTCAALVGVCADIVWTHLDYVCPECCWTGRAWDGRVRCLARRRRYCIGSRGWDAFLCRLASNRTLIWRHHGVHIAGFRERLVGRTRWARSHTRLVTYHQDLVARVCAVSATSAVLVPGLQLLMVPRRWCECSLLPRARRKKTTTACVVQLVRAQLRRWKRAQLAATPALRPDLGVAVSEAPVWVSLRICKLLTAPDHGARGAWPALAPPFLRAARDAQMLPRRVVVCDCDEEEAPASASGAFSGLWLAAVLASFWSGCPCTHAGLCLLGPRAVVNPGCNARVCHSHALS
jgi:hypothetical protein